MTGPATPFIPPEDTATTLATSSLYSSIRQLLLDYVDPMVTDPQHQIGALLAAVGGGQDRLYVRTVPNVNAVRYPYATLLLSRTSLAGTNGYGERATLEVQVVGNPAAQGPLVEWIADRIDRCLLSLLLTSGPGAQTDYGLVRCVNRQRATLPPFTTPADGNTYGVRLVADLWLYPRVLTEPRT